MSGFAYGQPEPTETCPYCGTTCHADFVDNGVCFQQCGPYHCERCQASEIGPYDEPRPLTAIEERYSWYAPGSEPGSSANIVAGKHVSHQQMKAVYQDAYFKDQENNGLAETILRERGEGIPRVNWDEWWVQIRKRNSKERGNATGAQTKRTSHYDLQRFRWGNHGFVQHDGNPSPHRPARYKRSEGRDL